MEKPELDKIIKKMENIDLELWGVSKPYNFDEKEPYKKPAFRAKTHGLEFYLRIESVPALREKHRWRYFLTITNQEKDINIEYENYKDKVEQKVLSNFYEDLHKKLKDFVKKNLEEHRKQFKERLEHFLLD